MGFGSFGEGYVPISPNGSCEPGTLSNISKFDSHQQEKGTFISY